MLKSQTTFNMVDYPEYGSSTNLSDSMQRLWSKEKMLSFKRFTNILVSVGQAKNDATFSQATVLDVSIEAAVIAPSEHSSNEAFSSTVAVGVIVGIGSFFLILLFWTNRKRITQSFSDEAKSKFEEGSSESRKNKGDEPSEIVQFTTDVESNGTGSPQPSVLPKDDIESKPPLSLQAATTLNRFPILRSRSNRLIHLKGSNVSNVSSPAQEATLVLSKELNMSLELWDTDESDPFPDLDIEPKSGLAGESRV